MKALCIAALLSLAGCGYDSVPEPDQLPIVGSWAGYQVAEDDGSGMAQNYIDTTYVEVREVADQFVHGRIFVKHHHIQSHRDHTAFLWGNYYGTNLMVHYYHQANHQLCFMDGEVSTEQEGYTWKASSTCAHRSARDVFFLKEQDRWLGVRVKPERDDRDSYVLPSWNVADTSIWRDDGQPSHTAYTCTAITSVGVGDGLDREHIVALAEAWDSRPLGFTHELLEDVANDHLNLTIATAKANRSKGDKDAADWEPTFNGYWYAKRVLDVKRKYDLAVDQRERAALSRLMNHGTDAIECP